MSLPFPALAPAYEKSNAVNELLEQAIAAHGGMDRWNELSSVSARVLGGGALWGLKGQEGVLDDVVTRAELHRQVARTTPFGRPDLSSVVTPDRVVIETAAGEVAEERSRPRESFVGHEIATGWDRLHLAYFNGYAMWNYLTEPFLLAGPGFQLEELAPHHEDGEVWRALRVVFPDEVATHSREQTYYVDAEGHIRRHDYVPDVFGPGAPVAANYSFDPRRYDGILVPTRRLVYLLDAEGRPDKNTVIVSIELQDVRFQ
ncbi:hypothetical protein KBX37_20225 [Micromonospora sp. U56]|uniref:hypothetical protein n=1 Tax=Micromonospora sp. U56 TaxID=2824900 RepID=UPI001B36B47D|nr:hypothetical protein [Micromonospora sp. U56]MBQ0895399.1 hypothetical protein [Micromonospora sp. U56]